MKVTKFSYFVISDIHFGSNKNKTINIVSNLMLFFKEYHNILKTTNVIFIPGDIYDKLLTVPSNDNIVSMEWLLNLARYCSKNGIKLRIMEGTPSHDNRQGVLLYTALKEKEINVDYKYIDTIEIEYMDEYNKNILYIPDEMHHHADDTLNEVKSLMESKNLHQVDIAMMHGAFNYQIPVIELPSMHNAQEYLSLVKYYISIGHVHNHSVYKRILAQGSFDRLSHGEEEAKGGIYVSIKNGESSFMFLENKNAMIFKTISIGTEDLQEAINIVKESLINVPKESYIRLAVKEDNPIIKSLRDIYKHFPLYLFSSKTIKNETNIKVTVDNIIANAEFDNLYINDKNIEDLIFKELDIDNLDLELQPIIKEEISNII